LFSTSAELCSSTAVLVLDEVVIEIILPHQAAGVDIVSGTTAGFEFSE
jgi:hypothetical protein